MTLLDPWFIENLRCPVDHSVLRQEGNELVSAAGARYPIANGVPVMLRADTIPTIGLITESVKCGWRLAEQPNDDDWAIESLGVEADEKDLLEELRVQGGPVDPVASLLVGATNGIAYRSLIGKLSAYPIPELRTSPKAAQQQFLDIGCSWGRWCVAAARKGFMPVGIDPSLSAVLCAKRIFKQLGLSGRFVVADARYLPFRSSIFDQAFSYSVIQHFSKTDAATAFDDVCRVLKADGGFLIQLPNTLGIRCLWHQFRRGFREPVGFEVRYYSLFELQKIFKSKYKRVRTEVDCFFGIGFQSVDMPFMRPHLKGVLLASETLRRVTGVVPFLKAVADSLYVECHDKCGPPTQSVTASVDHSSR